jgi:hypothetical protein
VYQRQFETIADSYATTDATSGYGYSILLPAGPVWRIDKFYVLAQTTYAAQDTNYQTFTLCDASGNGIASVANGPATGGLAIGPAVVTGVDSTMTSTYQYIDCSSSAAAIYVKGAATGNGRAMVGLKFIVLATPIRP